MDAECDAVKERGRAAEAMAQEIMVVEDETEGPSFPKAHS
jgi:hypothetical protein